MRTWYFVLTVGLSPIPSYAETLAPKNAVIAKMPTIGCYYHDVLWDRTGYGKDGRPTPDFLALDTCTGIETGQKLELYEDQIYAPGGLKIVRIDDKLYFVRSRDVEKEKTKVAVKIAEPEKIAAAKK